MSLECVRIFNDPDGTSHFGAVRVELTSREFAPPAPPLEVSEIVDARHGLLRAPVGWFGDWHPTPVRQVMCLLRGELEVSVSDGETRQMAAGEVAVLEDTEGRGHTTRVVSDEPALLVFAQLG